MKMWLFVGLGIGLGFLAGWVDFHNEEPLPALLILIVSAVMLGFFAPRQAWLWAVLTGVGVFAGHISTTALGFQLPIPKPSGVFASLLPLIPGFIGAYVGAFTRRLFV